MSNAEEVRILVRTRTRRTRGRCGISGLEMASEPYAVEATLTAPSKECLSLRDNSAHRSPR